MVVTSVLPATIGVELLSDYRWLLALVAVLARLARGYQHGLTWLEYRALHRLKRGVFPPLGSARRFGLPSKRLLLTVEQRVASLLQLRDVVRFVAALVAVRFFHQLAKRTHHDRLRHRQHR